MTNQKEYIDYLEFGSLNNEPIVVIKEGEIMTKERIDQLYVGIQQTVQLALSKQREEINKRIDKLYPPVFIQEISYGEGVIARGKQEETCIRRLTIEEQQILSDITNLIK